LLHRTQAYSWAPRVEAGQREAFEQRASVCLRSATRSVTRCARRLAGGPARDHYYPVLYTQASSQQGQPYGLDLLGQPKRAATLARAMAPGSMAVSEPLDMLSVDPAYSRGLLMVAPVFAESGRPVPAQAM
jgi:CHASE1-domain containing sensor protein